MSKRFGRNQRRKLREELAQANKERHHWMHEYRKEREAGARNRETVEETARVLGSAFITLPPQCVEVEDVDRLAYGWRTCMDRAIPWVQPDQSTPSACEFVDAVLPVLLYNSTKRLDSLFSERHFRFTRGGRVMGYGISDNALGMLSPKGAARRISEEVAAMIMQDFRG